MCIKSAPYIHQKGASRALDIVLFGCFGADAKFALNRMKCYPK